MDQLLRDLRYGIRRLVRTPGFTTIVVLTLALGIGANTAIFSVVHAVLLRPLPYRQPDRLVTVNHFYESLNNLEASVSGAGFRDYRDHVKSFEGVAAETQFAANLTGAGEPERVPASRVSGDFFRVLGVSPLIGRGIARDDDEPGKDRVVVLSYGLWQRVFAGDRAIQGKNIELNGESYVVIGVMPPEFRDFFSRTTDVWTPLALTPEQLDPRGYTNEFLALTARLRSGVTLAQARSELRSFAEQLKKQYPDRLGPRWTLHARSLNELATGKIRPALLVLTGAVGFVLLIACANVANLMLARAAARSKEVAIRTALGADRAALLRQLLTESVLLAVVGAGLGLAVAHWSVKALVALVPSLPRGDEIGLNSTVLLFTLGMALVAGVLFGLAPALQATRTNLQDTLKEGGRTGASDVSGRLLRRSLVVAEAALALTLLAGAGLLIKSVARLQSVSPGFRPDHLLTFNVGLPRVRYPSDTARTQFYDAVLARLSGVPGVTGVAVTSVLPFGGGWSTSSFGIEDYTPPNGQPQPWGDIRVVNPDFFRAMGIPLVAGRGFTAADGPGSDRVVVIDQELAQRYFKGQDPLGRRLIRGFGPDGKPLFQTVIGVVGHAAHEGLDAEPRVQRYIPYAQGANTSFSAFLIRTTGEPLAMVRPVADAIHSVDKDVPLANPQSMDALMETAVGQRRVSMLLLGAFAAIALVLASIGLYGVMSYSVTQRSRELGVRMALGAVRSRVLTLVVGQGMSLAVLGIGIGLAGALGLTRFLGTQLYHVAPTDVPTFARVAALLAGVSLVATLVPALRATRVDPVVSLREE